MKCHCACEQKINLQSFSKLLGHTAHNLREVDSPTPQSMLCSDFQLISNIDREGGPARGEM